MPPAPSDPVDLEEAAAFAFERTGKTPSPPYACTVPKPTDPQNGIAAALAIGATGAAVFGDGDSIAAS